MRDQWFSDVKDIVKWGVIDGLASEHRRATRILYVAMRTRDDKKYRELVLDNGKSVPVAIYKFFRGIDRLGDLPWSSKVRFEPILEFFEHRYRGAFFERVRVAISKGRKTGERTVLFLDPDTGIEPPKTVDKKHVKESELRELFGALEPNDLLSVYQHKTRDAKWLLRARSVLAKATARQLDSVEVHQGSDLTKQLAVLVVRRGG